MQYSNNMVIQNMFLLLIFSLVHFQDAAEISDIIATEGQNVTLACAHSPPKQGTFYRTFWYKGKMKVFTIKPNGKFSISSHRKHPIYVGGNYSMILSQVDRYDHGTYSCKSVYLVPGKPSSKTVMVSLYVKARPIISSTSPSVQNMTQSLDARDLSLVCSVSAYPEAEAIWRKVDGQLPVNRKTQYVNGTLVLKEATKVDSGTYVCVASNELGTDSKNFTVTVFEPPQIIGNRRFHVNAGETASLICLSRGNPNPTFTWTWNDAENNTVSLSEGEESSPYSVTTTHTNTSSHSTLEIKKSNKELWKNYTCKVENVLGTDSAVISLQGKTRPESPHVVSVDTTDTQAEVTWEFGDNGGLELTSLTLQYKESSKSQWVSIQLKPPDGAKYTIVDLKPNTSYNFRILATNSLGTSPPSLMFQAKTSKSESNISAQSDEQDKGLTGNMTALIAGVAGGFLAVIIAIVGVFCFVRKIHKNSTPGNTPVNSRPTSQQEQTEMSVLLPHQIPNIPQPLQPDAGLGATANPLSNSRWEFPRDRLHLQTVLGSGAFGLVMKAQAQGIKGCVGKMFVAVKIVKESDSETARKDLAAELDLLKLIDPHPNVIGLLGCCTRTAPMMVIVEFCSFGDLQSYLRHCRGVEDKYYQDLYKVPIEKLGSRDLLSFAIQTARGMAHLAGMKVVHRDLAARNVLIDENKVCKVADFGFARDIYVEDHYTRKTQGGRFPIKWMAIESLLDGVSTTKSDVWSFGIVLWEIVTLGASPYPGMNSQEVINFLQDSYRMDKPKHCSEELYVLMLDCWQVAPQRRPTFLEMSRHLSKMISDDREYINMRMYEDHLYINFDKTTGTAPSASGTGTDADSAM